VPKYGDQDLIRSTADALRKTGDQLTDIGIKLRRTAVDSWQGRASEEFHSTLRELGNGWVRCGDLLSRMGNDIEKYADVLLWGRQEGQRAAELRQRAEELAREADQVAQRSFEDASIYRLLGVPDALPDLSILGATSTSDVVAEQDDIHAQLDFLRARVHNQISDSLAVLGLSLQGSMEEIRDLRGSESKDGGGQVRDE
jgi:uncharacterized protein YukE